MFRRHWKSANRFELRGAERDDLPNSPEPLIRILTHKGNRCHITDIGWSGVQLAQPHDDAADDAQGADGDEDEADHDREDDDDGEEDGDGEADNVGEDDAEGSDANNADDVEANANANNNNDDDDTGGGEGQFWAAADGDDVEGIGLSDEGQPPDLEFNPGTTFVDVEGTATDGLPPASASVGNVTADLAAAFADKGDGDEKQQQSPVARPTATLAATGCGIHGTIEARLVSAGKKPRTHDDPFGGNDHDADDHDDNGVVDDGDAGGMFWTNDDAERTGLANDGKPHALQIGPKPAIVDSTIAATDAVREGPGVAERPMIDPEPEVTGPRTMTSVADRAPASAGGHQEAPKSTEPEEEEEEEQSLASESNASVDDFLDPVDVGIVPSWSLSDEDKAWVDRTILLLLDSADAAFPLDEMDIRRIISYASRTMTRDVRSLTLESPITICGDLHGHFTNLRNALTVGEKLTQVCSFSRRLTGLDIEPLRLSRVLSCPSTLAQDALPR
jgi:hypothetical protein